MKRILLLFTNILFYSIICNGQSSGKIEDRILDTISKLPEVNKSSKYVETQTKGKRHLQFVIWQKPNKDHHHYYWVKVMEDNDMTMYTHFNFYVYPKNLLIKYLDTPHNDALLTLE